MKIESYAVKASSEREYTKLTQVSSLLVKGEIPVIASPAEGEKSAGGAKQEPVEVSISDVGKKFVEDGREARENMVAGLKSKIIETNRSFPTNPVELKLRLLEQILSAISGKRSVFAKYRGIAQRAENALNIQAFQNAQPVSTANARGLFLQTESFVYESEKVSYQAQGVINTADGKSITVDVSLSMSREYASYSMVQQQIKTIDPLVINYGGTAASLTGERFAFDLDVDGQLDMISSLGAGSGFLALDKNGDGVINDGSELFGPQSGSGFDDLRGYDSDGNGWIDENDGIFNELRIWSKDSDGNDQLFSLLELDVGAIYLGDVATEFSMNDSNNNTNGVMRSTSFFLKESGGAGTISHIDLAL